MRPPTPARPAGPAHTRPTHAAGARAMTLPTRPGRSGPALAAPLALAGPDGRAQNASAPAPSRRAHAAPPPPLRPLTSPPNRRADSGTGASTSNSATSTLANAGSAPSPPTATPRPFFGARRRAATTPTPAPPPLRRHSGAHPPPADPAATIGWSVVHAQTGEAIGVVAGVETEEGAGQGGKEAAPSPGASSSLRVVSTDLEPRFAAAGAVEAHLVPYVVPDIVVSARVGVGQVSTLAIDPPPGLLDLGRRRLLIAYLGPRLRAAAARLAGGGEGGGDGDGGDGRSPAPAAASTARALASPSSGLPMPTKAQLDAAGEADLARDIADAGGFATVALAVGLRPRRRPVGYWDNPDNLDGELALFVAAQWVELEEQEEEEDGEEEDGEHGGEGEGGGEGVGGGPRATTATPPPRRTYFYNVATRRVRWTPPVAPVTVALDETGSAAIRVEDAASSRSMPSRSSILAAGRYDLHHAVVYAGGYRAVGAALGRPPAWPPSAAHARPGALGRALRAFAAQRAREGGGDGNGGGGDRGGGPPPPPSSPSSSASTPAVRRTSLHMPTRSELLDAGRADLVAAVSAAGGFRAGAAAAGLACRRRPPSGLAAAAAEMRAYCEGAGLDTLPSHAHLRSAGRHDLRYAVQLHGAEALAREARVRWRGRGRPRKD